MEYKTTIGLEIHVELNTKSKMFCSCRNDSQEKTPNVNICPICLSHPGTLPVINKEAVKKVIKTAQALNCHIQSNTYFERKNYFYPDLPKGYQISQYAAPIGKKGYLEIFSSPSKKIRIERVHLEEDTGKLIHPEGTNYSLVDFNRAGIPLMELVTEPDLTLASEAREFTQELQLILRYLGVSEVNMEKGEMRCEVNISLKQSKLTTGQAKKLGTKVEIKNLNSLKVVEKSIEYEIERQSEILDRGEKVIQETRGWDEKRGKTLSQRKKEEAHDYRYFPEPDLPRLEFSEEFLKNIKKEIIELPLNRTERFKKDYYLSEKEIEIYLWQKELGDYFEKVASELRQWLKEKKQTEQVKPEELKKVYKLASNYISTDVQGILKGKSLEEEKFPITPENFAEFISMIYLDEISSKIAKTLLKAMFETGGDPSQIMKDKGLKLITDEKQIEKVVKEIIEKNQKAVEDYKKGKKTAIQFLVGQVMAKTKGTAGPEKVIEILKKLLK